MAGPANPKDVQRAWPFPVSKPPVTDREKQVWRALTTVNRDDFTPKPPPETPQAD